MSQQTEKKQENAPLLTAGQEVKPSILQKLNVFKKIDDFFNFKFSAKQWFGTLYMPAVIYWNIQVIKASKDHQIESRDAPGQLVTQKLWAHIIGSYVYNANNLWTILSDRKAIPPEGKNPLERMKNALLHPRQSQYQATYATSLPFYLVSLYTNFYLGFNGREEEKRSQIITAVTGTINTWLSYSTVFGKNPDAAKTIHKHENANATRNGKKIDNTQFYPLKVIKIAWRDNRKQIFAAFLSLASAFAGLAEGFAKRKSRLEYIENASTPNTKEWCQLKNATEQRHGEHLSVTELSARMANVIENTRKNAEPASLIKKNLVGIALILAGSFYNMDQLVKGQQEGRESANKAPTDSKTPPFNQQAKQMDEEWRDWSGNKASIPDKETSRTDSIYAQGKFTSQIAPKRSGEYLQTIQQPFSNHLPADYSLRSFQAIINKELPYTRHGTALHTAAR